jgi:hypothetical protein
VKQGSGANYPNPNSSSQLLLVELPDLVKVNGEHAVRFEFQTISE